MGKPKRPTTKGRGNRSEEALLPSQPQALPLLLQQVDGLLRAGNAEKALHLVRGCGMSSPWLINALGVCQLRLGNAKPALEIYRRLVLELGGTHLRTDVPAVFRINFAQALLSTGHVEGCLSALDEVATDHPAAARIRGAVARWEDSLTFWERLQWHLGGEPARPVLLDYPPGDLE